MGEFSGFAFQMKQDAPRRWRPSPLLYASAAVHLGAGAGVLARPQVWPWALGAVAANHIALAAAGLWARRPPLRDDRHAPVAISIDDGPEPDVTPRVLAQLEAQRACAPFFCVGERVL